MNAQVSVVKCDGYAPVLVEAALRNVLNLLGGLTGFVKPGSRVLVKPNLMMSKPPEFGITTHPEVVRAMIHLLKEIDCRIVVGDGPSVWSKYIENVDEVYEITGISKVCQQEGVKLISFDKRRMRNKFPLTAALDECDYLINLPKFKTHGLTLISGAIKNLFGLVSGTFKTELHKDYPEPFEFAKILVDVYQESKPNLTIMDGILAMEGNGPGTSGKTRQLNLLLGSSDCVAIDTVMAKIMGFNNYEIMTTKEAAGRGLGEDQINRIRIEGEDINQLNIRPFVIPFTAAKRIKLPSVLKKMLKVLIKYYPYSLRLKCTRCGHCVKICPSQCMRLTENGIQIDYHKCIACFCCQEICPAAAIGVRKSLLAKLIGL